MKKKFNKKIKEWLLWMIFIFFLTFFVVIIFTKEYKSKLNPLIISFQLTLFFGGLIFIKILFEYLAEKHVVINKLDKEDFINNEQLYRDILNNYSPVLLAFIDKMMFDYDISIVAGLLELKNKGYIEICEDRINIINYDCQNLNMIEKTIICNLRNGKVDKIINLENIVYEEGKKKRLLISNISKNVKLIKDPFIKDLKKIIVKIIKYYVCAFVLVKFYQSISAYLSSVIFDSIIIFGITFVFFYYSIYFKKKQENKIPYIRSKEAKELNLKLEGLKNYISQYSLLKEKKTDDILLWEEYLIYSIIFNQNKDIIKEYKKYYR